MRLKPLILLAMILTAACGKKDGPSCALPAELPRPMLEGPSSDAPRTLAPIAGYTLAVSWTPEYCATRMTSPADRLRCSGEAGEFGFTLHGLWPNGAGGARPQYCKPTRLVPEKVMREALCSTPSVQLVQHEWEKHGSCMADTAADYFAKSEPLYRALNYPDMAALRGKTVTVQAFREAFAGANEGMKPDQMRVSLTPQGGLDEVRICLGSDFKRTSCAPGDGAAANAVVRIR